MLGRLTSVVAVLLLFFGGAPAVAGESEVGRGASLFGRLGCVACHTVHGRGGNPGVKAPELAGLFGSFIELEDGQHVQATEEYLLESIIDPDAKVHKGYPAGVMPKAFAYLDPEDLKAVIDFLKSLSAVNQP